MEILEIAGSIVVSLAAGGGIVAGLSSWLGKVWAQRLMDRESAKHNADLAELRSKLERENQLQLSAYKNELELHADRQRTAFHDRIVAYRQAIDVIVDILADFDKISTTGIRETPNRYHELNRRRLQAYRYLGMLAGQSVMDAFDKLFDYIFEIAHGETPYVWTKVRELGLALLVEVRRDMPVEYVELKYQGRR